MGPKGSGPYSEAKQDRSFRMVTLKLPGSLCAHGGPFCSKTRPFFCWVALSWILNRRIEKWTPRVLVCAHRDPGHIL